MTAPTLDIAGLESVYDTLAAAIDQAGEQKSEQDERPMAFGGDAGRNDAAQECPHGRKPRDRLQQLQHGRPCGSPVQP